MSNQIFERMTKIMSEIDAIGKDQKNTMQKYNFRGIDDVMNSIHDVMAKHEVFVMPEFLSGTREERQTKNGGLLIYSICDYRFTFYTTDGSFTSCVVRGEGMDSGDKASNKAISVALKYALLQVFMIPTKDLIDPDSETPDVKPDKQPTVTINFESMKEKLSKMTTEEEINNYFIKIKGRPDRKNWTPEQVNDVNDIRMTHLTRVTFKGEET